MKNLLLAAILTAAPAAAQTTVRAPVSGLNAIPGLGASFDGAHLGPTPLLMPTLTPGMRLPAPSALALIPTLTPSLVQPVPAAGILPAAVKLVVGSPLAVIRDASVGEAQEAQITAALDRLFENSAPSSPEALEVSARPAAAKSPTGGQIQGIRLAMAPVAQALGLSPVTAKAQPRQAKTPTPTTAPAGTTASASPVAPAPAVPWSFRDDKEALQAFDEKVVGMAATFQTVPKGTFKMGSPASDKERSSDEIYHEVTIGYDYEMQTTPMTWGQLLRIVDLSTTKITIPDFAKDPKNSDGGKRETLQGIAVNSDHPVVNISWEDEQQLIDHLNSIQSEWTYRRPTEAEWERAARAGSEDSYPVKADMFGAIAKALKEIAWFSDNSGSRTHAVGKKQANKFGLRDMFGNVWEWMRDKYEGSYAGAPTDGSAFEGAGSSRVIRGGSWGDDARALRAAIRSRGVPGDRWDDFGARLVRSRR